MSFTVSRGFGEPTEHIEFEKISEAIEYFVEEKMKAAQVWNTERDCGLNTPGDYVVEFWNLNDQLIDKFSFGIEEQRVIDAGYRVRNPVDIHPAKAADMMTEWRENQPLSRREWLIGDEEAQQLVENEFSIPPK